MPLENSNVLIVAAEASSALYAQRILEVWQKSGREVSAFGVGSADMENLGFERLGKSEEMAVVGLTEIIAHYSEIKGCFNRLLEEARIRKPKFALLLDYPEFNMKLAKKLKAMGITVVYYISPQIWAWRQYRVHKIKKIVDHMLVLFPFEKEFYKQYGIDVTFVGHPLLDELKPEFFDNEEINKAKSKFGISKNGFVLGLMPGSRNSEINHHLATQMEVAKKVYAKNPQINIALLVAPSLDMEVLKEKLPEYDFPVIFLRDEPMKMVSFCDEILCASGTATLLVGLLKKPLVIMYKMKPLSAFLAKKFVKGTKHFGMINLVLGKRVAPEFFQEEASPDKLFSAVDDIMYDDPKRERMIEELSEASKKLGDVGVTQRVVKALEAHF